ncbi:hypothetical protein IQ288_28685 [Burkholderia sp. R-69980]|nr:hypothetical protein [Burkholderia sp. R-69980]
MLRVGPVDVGPMPFFMNRVLSTPTRRGVAFHSSFELGASAILNRSMPALLTGFTSSRRERMAVLNNTSAHLLYYVSAEQKVATPRSLAVLTECRVDFSFRNSPMKEPPTKPSRPADQCAPACDIPFA